MAVVCSSADMTATGMVREAEKSTAETDKELVSSQIVSAEQPGMTEIMD